jgi:hypothetical protein
MKSIIQEAIAKHQENQALVEEKKPAPTTTYVNADDEELAGRDRVVGLGKGCFVSGHGVAPVGVSEGTPKTLARR